MLGEGLSEKVRGEREERLLKWTKSEVMTAYFWNCPWKMPNRITLNSILTIDDPYCHCIVYPWIGVLTLFLRFVKIVTLINQLTT